MVESEMLSPQGDSFLITLVLTSGITHAAKIFFLKHNIDLVHLALFNRVPTHMEYLENAGNLSTWKTPGIFGMINRFTLVLTL